MEVLEEKLVKKVSKKNIRPSRPILAQKLYFYEKPNGEIFECRAREAEGIHKKFKQVGVSDGTRSAHILSELQKNYKKLSMKQIQSEMRRAWEEELEVARGKFEVPPNFSINTLGDPQLKQFLSRRYGQ